jgi:hypothetical protein
VSLGRREEEWYMKRFLVGLTVAAVAAIGFSSVAASASANKLQAFGTAVVTGPDSATIVNTAADQSGGVFLNSRNMSGKPLNAISFSFVSTGDVAGGAPRFSIPIDADGNASTIEGYAFLDAAGCGATVGPNTTVSTLVSTRVDTCQVSYNSQNYNYANWAAFAAANPTYRLDPGAIPFIIADVVGSYAVNSIDLH